MIFDRPLGNVSARRRTAPSRARRHVEGSAAGGVSVVILAHNRREALSLVLDRLEGMPVDEVLVVDNGSTDGTADMVAARGGAVRLLAPGTNVCIAGRNLAAREARGEYLLMLDDDSYPLPGAVEALLEALDRNPRLAVAGGLVRDVAPDGMVTRLDEPGTFHWWFRQGRKGPVPAAGWPTFFFPECGAMLRRSAFLDVGGFFEPYFFTVSEVDLTTRLVEAGWDVRYFPMAVFDHMKAQTGRVDGNAVRRYRVRNQLWYFWLRFPAFLALRRGLAYLLFDLVECAWHGALRQWAGGIADAWRQRDTVRPYRRPLPRQLLRRAEMNRGRMHLRLLVDELWLKARRAFGR